MENKKSKLLKKFLNEKYESLVASKEVAEFDGSPALKHLTSLSSEVNKESSVSSNPVTCDDESVSSSENRADKINKKRIFVENIEWSVHENLFEKFFSKFGTVKKSKIIRSHEQNKSKGKY